MVEVNRFPAFFYAVNNFRTHSNIDTNVLYSDLKHKIDTGKKLSDEDVMRFIIMPLTEPLKNKKQVLIEKTVDLAKSIADEEQQLFVIAGILVATDKFINKEYSSKIKEWIAMTKVARLFEEEKIEAVNEAVKSKASSLAIEMLLDDEDIFKIMKYSKLSKKEIEELQEELGLIT